MMGANNDIVRDLILCLRVNGMHVGGGSRMKMIWK